MEADKNTIEESLAYARDMEIILNDKKKISHVSQIQAQDTEDAPPGINK